jgi:hypothetical protein
MTRPTTKLLLALVALSGCGVLESDAGELTAGMCQDEDTNPDEDISFRSQILPMLQMGCGCHNPAGSGSQIDATGFSVGDYAAIRRGGQQSRDRILVDNKPCDSYLYLKLSDAPPTGARMPLYGPYWSRAEMAMLHDWIAEGARAD